MKTATDRIQTRAAGNSYIKRMTLNELEQFCDDPARDLPGSKEVQVILAFNVVRGFSLLAQHDNVIYSICNEDGEQVQYRTIEQAIDYLQDLPGLSGDIRLDISGA